MSLWLRIHLTTLTSLKTKAGSSAHSKKGYSAMSAKQQASTRLSAGSSGPRAAKSLDDLIAAGTWRQNSGLEIIEGMMCGKFTHPPISGVLGFHLVEAEFGRVTFEGRSDFSFCNPMGTVHGGWYTTLLDSAMACAVIAALPKGRLFTTLELKVNFVKSVPIGHTVLAKGRTVHVGRTTAVAEASLHDAEERLYCTSSSTGLIVKLPESVD